MSKVNAILRTKSLRGGHFRAGRKHEEAETDFPPGTFEEEDVARLQADPDLEVRLLEPPRKKKSPEPAPETDGAAPAEEGEDFDFDEPEAKDAGK